MDNCLEFKYCRKPAPADSAAAQSERLEAAISQLQLMVASATASLDSCFVFTLENRNSLMNHIADVKHEATVFGCGYLIELCALAEIITMILFRSGHYRDRQGLAQIEQAVAQMRVCCTTKADPKGQSSNSIAETVERLWRWVDTNTLPGIHSL